MLGQKNATPYLTHISLALVGLMWVFPFLHVRHEYPITTFYQEWWSGLLGILATGLLVERDYWEKLEIPRITHLAIGMFAIVLLQYALGKIAYFDQVLLYGMYLLFVTLLMLLGARLRENIGLLNLAQMLAAVLLIGAELNTFVGVLQHYAWHTLLDSVITAKMSAAVYGNLAQPNHFANYIALGLISLGFLFQQKKINPFVVAVLALPMLFVMAMSASRSSWLYVLTMLAMSWWWSRRDASLKPLLRYSLLLVAGFAMMHFAASAHPLATQTGSVDTVQRLLAHEETGHIRLYLWREAVLMFMQSPIIGVGFGQFAWQHFQLVPILQPGNIVGLYNNAHNLIMQLMSEMGAAGLLVFCISLGIWMRGLRRTSLDAAHWWGYAILTVLGIHSLLEYPLWYSYFLAIAAVLLGMFDVTRYKLTLRFVGRKAVAAMLLLGMIVLLQLMVGYSGLQRATTMNMADAPISSVVAKGELAALHRVPLLSPYTEMLMGDRMEINEQYLDEKLALNTRLTRFAPIGTVVFRQALLLAQANQLESAKTIWNQAAWSYPGDLDFWHKALMKYAVKDPAHFSALLEFANRGQPKKS